MKVLAALGKLLPSRNERLLRRYRARFARVDAAALAALDDAALRARADDYRERFARGEDPDALAAEVFALVREAAARALGMRPFDVQMLGALALHEGKIAEMRTGEGKTLAATMPACLNALAGRSVHIVTVNDYLARRDAEWMGPVYRFLGLEVGQVLGGQDGAARQQAYQADVVYGTNNEFGFDYLRDNMVLDPAHRVQRGLHYAIVDEVDSILIDEARTPLIISGPAESKTDMYLGMRDLAARLNPEAAEGDGGDYTVDEKARQAVLTEAGHERVEQELAERGLLEPGDSLYDSANLGLIHDLNAALRAKALFKKNIDYLVRDGSVLIVDEFTGRVMPGRRWSDGLHQAIEAKEGVEIRQENQTMASVTFQNYFRGYERLAGMTGTADTEAYEFQQIYGLEVVVVPTHREMIREDHGDVVYLTADEKYKAIIDDIKECVAAGQPTLVGTASIESSERLAGMLRAGGIAHQVLNAKHHEAESHIIAQAGAPGAVTIATNMAGRGTDIVLGGALDDDADAAARAAWEERHRRVVAAGGLHIVGTERHESRRIDNQLRGRSGRQGDPGSSRFYLSLEDNLMRIFASDKVKAIMDRLGMEPGEAIEHPWVTRSIENAQRKVEAHNFDMRKTLLEYDDIAGEQRAVVYRQRDEILDAENVQEIVAEMRADVIGDLIDRYMPPGAPEEMWDAAGLALALEREFDLRPPLDEWLQSDPDALSEKVTDALAETTAAREREAGGERWRAVEKIMTLQNLDHHWREHLAAMDYLRQSIGLRSFAQRNPKQEYKREAFRMFEAMLARVRHDIVAALARIEFAPPPPPALRELQARNAGLQFRHDSAPSAAADDAPAGEPAAALAGAPAGAPAGTDAAAPPVAVPSRAARRRAAARPVAPARRERPKIGRNEPCFCGSGKKYKQCHGRSGTA